MIENPDFQKEERERRRPSQRVFVVAYDAETPAGDAEAMWNMQMEGGNALGVYDPPINFSSNVRGLVTFDSVAYLRNYFPPRTVKELTGRRVPEPAKLATAIVHRMVNKLGILEKGGTLNTDLVDPFSVSNYTTTSFGQMTVFGDVEKILSQEMFVDTTRPDRMISGEKWLTLSEDERQSWRSVGVDRVRNSQYIDPFTPLRAGLEQVNGTVSSALGTHGDPLTSSEACSTGLSSVADGYFAILGGRAKIVLAGAVDIASVDADRFHGVFGPMRNAVTRRNDDPSTASRPLGEGRDGFAISEGAAYLTLMSFEEILRLRSLGVEIPVYAEIVNARKQQNSTGEPTALSSDIVAHTIASTVYDGRTGEMHDPDVLVVHDTGTDLGDLVETEGYRKAFGPRLAQKPMISNKQVIGHTLGAAGAVSAINAVQVIEHQEVPPFRNAYPRDPRFSDLWLPPERLPMRVKRSMASAFGFGGYLSVVGFREVR